MFTRILVAVDGSDASQQGLSKAIDIAAAHGAALHVLHVVDGLPVSWCRYVDREFRPSRVELLLQGLRAAGRKLLDDARELAHRHGQAAELLLVDSRGRSFADTTLSEAERIGADLLVLGTHGRDGIERLVRGSDAESLLRRASVPVLLVRRTAPIAVDGRDGTRPAPRDEPRAEFPDATRTAAPAQAEYAGLQGS